MSRVTDVSATTLSLATPRCKFWSVEPLTLATTDGHRHKATTPVDARSLGLTHNAHSK
ncbi:hypothetical protein RRSWK_03875 [Rhodopirellula sp. SWK7]|nr:hypothetical protein RRSWK_03875 [Rhodopirellula sp. SWK7]